MKITARAISFSVLLIIAVLTSSAALAQSTAPAPPATQSDSGPLQVVISAVQGQAQYRTDEDQKWKSVTVGLNLAEGVEFRTGPKGVIQFVVQPDSVYRLDRLSSAKILRANLQDGVIKTDLGLAYGRVNKDMDAPSRPHDDTVVSPSSTLAIRGTRISVYDQAPFAPQFVSLTGRVHLRRNGHGEIALGSKDGSPVQINGDDSSAGQTALNDTVTDPISFFDALTGPERLMLGYLPSLGGNGWRNTGVPGGARSAGAGATIDSLFIPESLTFSMNSSSIITNPAMLVFSGVHFSVDSPLRETVSEFNQTVPSGGTFTGGSKPNGNGDDFSSVSWTNAFPRGTFTIHESLNGGQGADVNVTVIQGGGTVIGTFHDLLFPATPSASHSLSVTRPVGSGT